MKLQIKYRATAICMATIMPLALMLSGCGQTSDGTNEQGFAGGDGTKENPYQIATEEQLNLINNDLSANYELTADIDLSGTEDWIPIGAMTLDSINKDNGEIDFTNAFAGSFDGQGHTISNLSCIADDDDVAAGLFGCVTGNVQNFTLENVIVTGNANNMAIGGAIGYGLGDVKNITLSGENTVTGTNCVGGIVGGNQGTIDSCTVENGNIVIIGDNDFSSGEIIQCDVAECGGLVVGGSFMGEVNNCDATGNVTAEGNEPVGLGGIAGCIQCAASINGNTVTATINAGNGHAIGGLCGFAGMGDDGDGTVDEPCAITDCSADVTIVSDGATHVGGLVGTGLYYYGMEDRYTVENCKVTGTIDGATTPGTVAGRAAGSTIISCDTDVLIDGTKGDTQIGATTKLYQGGDQDADKKQAETAVQLDAISDTYQQLFEGATFEAKCDGYWHDAAAAIVGESGADSAVEMLKSSIGGKLYGQDAIDAYSDNPDSTQFFCGFTQDVVNLTFDGTEISGTDKDGNEIFNHTYKSIGEYAVGADEGIDSFTGFALESLDENSGEFTYFLLMPDTPESTYHIEFRYGSNLDDLQKYATGADAYWLAAGIPTSALDEKNDETLKNVIELFCSENLAA